MSQYAGAEWLERNLKIARPGVEISQFGRQVADLLGYAYRGLYHLSGVEKRDWNSEDRITVPIYGDLSTFDFDILTVLVFLAHSMAIRLEVQPAGPRMVRLLFSKRQRDGNIFDRHPTIREALTKFEEECYLTEV